MADLGLPTGAHPGVQDCETYFVPFVMCQFDNGELYSFVGDKETIKIKSADAAEKKAIELATSLGFAFGLKVEESI